MLGDNTARNDKFHCLIINWVTLVHIQPRPLVLKAATATKMGHSIHIKVSSKASSENAQTTVSENRYTNPFIDVFRMVILSLLASAETMCGHHFWHTSYRIPPLQSCVITECLRSFVFALGSPITYVVS